MERGGRTVERLEMMAIKAGNYMLAVLVVVVVDEIDLLVS